MESWFFSCWMVFVLFRHTSAEPAPPPRYVIPHTRASFERALEQCSPGGLTTLTTEQELAEILGLVSRSVSPLNQNEFTYWVGLRKVKNECGVSTLPLRGFKWTEDGSEESQVSRWTVEPKDSCTTVRCAALKGEVDGSTVTQWGLIPVTCKNSYQFICKLREAQTLKPPQPITSEPPPATPEPQKPLTPEPQKPATPEPQKPATPEPHKPQPATQKPEPASPEPELPTREPEAITGQTPTTGAEPQGPDPDRGSEPAVGSDLCQRPIITNSRSLSLDPDKSSRIQVECWSTIRLELHCSGRPAVWRLLDDSPANLTTICQPCDDGFQKNTNGTCVDIDECRSGGASCRHTCLNTEGSYRCVCSDENGKQLDDDSPECKKDTLINGDSTWLIAVAAVVVLVVLVAVIVKCCLVRRSKKRAMKKAEKMAMKSKDDKDSFETEKAAS